MSYNLTTWTEYDPQSLITVAADTANFNSAYDTGGQPESVYTTLGANEFDEDTMTIHCAGVLSGVYFANQGTRAVEICKATEVTYDTASVTQNIHVTFAANGSITFGALGTGSGTGNTVYSLSAGVWGYIKLIATTTAGVTDLTCYIYSDAAETNLLNTVSANGAVGVLGGLDSIRITNVQASISSGTFGPITVELPVSNLVGIWGMGSGWGLIA